MVNGNWLKGKAGMSNLLTKSYIVNGPLIIIKFFAFVLQDSNSNCKTTIKG